MTISVAPRRALLRAAGALAAAPIARGAGAQPAPSSASAYPAKTITFVVSYPAGGDTDALARVFAEKLAARVGRSVIVENRPGASGTIGNAFVAKAAPDGYTLLVTPNTISIATLVLNASGPPAYDAVRDFAPIVQIGSQSLFAVVNSSTGVTSTRALLQAAKAGSLATYATPGSGSPMHILGELVNRAAGVSIRQVPYRGSAPAIADLVGGHVPLMYTTLGPVAQYVASGRLVPVAVADRQRSPLLPNVPTLAEDGLKDVEVGAWQGVMGPRGLPPDVVATLNGHLNEIIKLPDVAARLQALATIPVGGDGARLGQLHAADHARYRVVIKELGIQAD